MRRNFSSSRLVQLLSDSSLVDVDANKQDFAERLSLWLDAFDAIKLQAAQQSIKTIAGQKPMGARAARNCALEEDFHQVRTALLKTIGANDSSSAGKKGSKSLSQPGTPVETDVEYGPYRQRHLDLQRQMELRIAPLRAHVRQSLAGAGPRLRQLAVLDAALEETLGGREQKLLATVPALLERRFDHLRQAHRQGLEAAGQPDDPASWRQKGGWLEVFGREWREVLLAEMNVRLQPVAGLIEAFSNEFKKYQ